MPALTEYYIMTIDGRCFCFPAKDKVSAFCIAARQFEYESFDEFLGDVNLCEWKDEEHRIVEWYSGNETTTERFNVNSPYQLKEYCKLYEQIQIIEE